MQNAHSRTDATKMQPTPVSMQAGSGERFSGI
jgi:hypothetical protein